MRFFEANFDGLVGNTHNYAGLSFGNLASSQHQGQTSSPKAAALQGLLKMKALSDKGLVQGILPPHVRPYLPYLRQLGFTGNDSEILKLVSAIPTYLSVSSSASNMWVANAATTTPSSDNEDNKLHFTPANLRSMLHRSIEVEQTAHALRCIFNDENYFSHHAPLTGNIHGDEGAANHTRFCRNYGDEGVHLFVYGQSFFNSSERTPQLFPARQSRESFAAIARLHQLNPAQCIFAQQNPDVIDKGVFHNDVIAVGNQTVLFVHEKAFANQQSVYSQLHHHLGADLQIIEVPESAVAVEDAVASYLFNAQLVTTDKGVVLIAPSNCQENPAVNTYCDYLKQGETAIQDVQFFDLKQSMSNGGGPACLRLRVVLSEDELNHISGNVILTSTLYNILVDWVHEYYRDSLHPSELADVTLLNETYQALTALKDILQLPDLYPDIPVQ